MTRLRILLHIPRLTTGNQGGSALMILARSVVNIINIHTEAAEAGKLGPSWPQLIRIMTCGQLLVLCCARGELHTLEATAMFVRLLALLGAHTNFWPAVHDAITGFRLAALRFGMSQRSCATDFSDIIIPGSHSKAAPDAESEPVVYSNETDWSATFVDPEIEALVDLPSEQSALW